MSTAVKTDIVLGDNFEGLFPEFDKDLIEHIYNELYNIEDRYPIDVSDRQISRIPFRIDLLRNAIDMLSSIYYEGLQIIVDQGPYKAINWKVQRKIMDKIESGQQLNKLERIIMDVGAMIMGGAPVSFDGGYDSSTIEEYERETGKKAFQNNRPTKSFQKWYNVRQVKGTMEKKVDDYADVITEIRNSYIHGDSIKKIEKIINKHYHDQDIGSLTLATREKIFRAFLFILLLNKQSPHWRIFNSDKKFIFKYPLKFFKFQTKFYEWIQYGTEMELGKLEKFKRITGLRLINI